MGDLAAGEVVILYGMGCAVSLAIWCITAALLSTAVRRVPAASRQIEPGSVWLLLIPLFNLVWNFIVTARVSKSLKTHFDSVGRTDVGDCGASIGLAYSICAACSVIPLLGCLTGLAALVLLIIYLVQILGLSNQVQAPTVTATPGP